MMTPAASPIANSLMSGPGPVDVAKNANMSTTAPLVTSLPVRARPSAIAVGRVASLVVLLADARDHEDLVVHRDPEQEREDDQRELEMTTSVAWTLQIASLPWPCWKMKTTTP